jgi:phosphoglycerate dehydrogenase-like enzyme
MQVLVFSRNRVTEKNVQVFHGRGGLERLLSSSHVIVSTLPLNKTTERLIRSKELSIMKKDAILVNIGRAEIIDQASLYDHLAKNPSFVYATDVWWLKNGKEELAPAYPFLSLPNFIGTPHASGPSAALTGKPMELAVVNTLRFLKGQKPRNIVIRSEYL